MTAATSSRLIRELTKNRSEVVRVTVDEWKGQTLINVRVWYKGEDEKWWPGKQGLAVRVELAADLARAIGEAAS